MAKIFQVRYFNEVQSFQVSATLLLHLDHGSNPIYVSYLKYVPPRLQMFSSEIVVRKHWW